MPATYVDEILVKDEGTSQGYVQTFNFVGPGIASTAASGIGTVTASSTAYDSIYARLDATNQPFTNHLTISTDKPKLYFNRSSDSYTDQAYLELDGSNYLRVVGLSSSFGNPTNIGIVAGTATAPDLQGGFVDLSGGVYGSGGDLFQNGFVRTGSSVTSFGVSNYINGSATSGNSVSDFAVDGNLYVSGFVDFAGGIGLFGKALPTGYSILTTGESAQTIGMDRTNLGTNGFGLTIQAGWAKSGGTNLNGGNLTLAPGKATGTGTASVFIQAVGGGVSGTSDSTPSTVMTWGLTTGTFRTLGYTFVSDTTTGVKFGSATNQKFSFYNATPVAQQTNTTDLGVVLSNFGIRASGTAYVLTTSGQITFNGTTDASSTTTGIVKISGGIGVAKTVWANNIAGDGTLLIKGISTFQAGFNYANRVVTAAGAVSVTTADYVVIVNKTVGAATTVNLPSPSKGDIYVIKDGKGDAATNNITLTPAAGNIDGAATYVMNTNYQSVTLIFNGTQWNVI